MNKLENHDEQMQIALDRSRTLAERRAAYDYMVAYSTQVSPLNKLWEMRPYRGDDLETLLVQLHGFLKAVYEQQDLIRVYAVMEKLADAVGAKADIVMNYPDVVEGAPNGVVH